MALAACQAQGLCCRSTVICAPSARRATTASTSRVPPSAFFESDVHASCSSIAFSEGRSTLDAVSRPGGADRGRRPSFVVRGLFGLGALELLVIAGVAALLFGPKQLPQIGKSLGQTMKSFQQAAKEFESEVSGSKDPKGDSVDPNNSSTLEGSQLKETITSTPIATPSKPEEESL